MESIGENFVELLNSLPINIRNIIKKLPDDVLCRMEEIRIRLYKPLMVHIDNEEKFVSSEGELVNYENMAYIVTGEDCDKAIQLISKSSVYAFDEEIKNGYITLKGGYRVGLSGKCVVENGNIKTIRNISGYNYRIMREITGVSDDIIGYIVKSPYYIYNTLIISPPQCGKTTLLRDIARNISNGIGYLNFKGQNIGIIDERSEIAACYNGLPQNNVGVRTDILDGCPKAFGIIMMIRSMSPKVLITDEIGKIEDVIAIQEALNAGIKIITTIHGNDIDDILRKPYIKDLIELREFERYIILNNEFGAGTIKKITDGDFNLIYKGPYRKGFKKK